MLPLINNLHPKVLFVNCQFNKINFDLDSISSEVRIAHPWPVNRDLPPERTALEGAPRQSIVDALREVVASGHDWSLSTDWGGSGYSWAMTAAIVGPSRGAFLVAAFHAIKGSIAKYA